MAYVIGEDCISCGTCAGECPVEAISEGAERYVIDADACTECGAFRTCKRNKSPADSFGWGFFVLAYAIMQKKMSIYV